MSLWRQRPERVATKIEVGILGATAMVGQQLIALLEQHPWFQITWLAASEPSQGHRYGDLPWRLPGKVPAGLTDQKVEAPRPRDAPQLVFSALDAAAAGEMEPAFAAAGHYVVSNARNFRMDPFVPLLIPEVNAQHLDLVLIQQQRKRWRGAIVTNPNCSTIFLAIVLAALREFHVKRGVVTTMQALSGAGYPGVASADSAANVIPWIEGEEEEIEIETQKILGRFMVNSIEPASVQISAQASRVPVLHGHTEMVSLEMGERVSSEQVEEAFREFPGVARTLHLPSAPTKPIVVHLERDRPQPRLDAETGAGMLVHVGRVRKCSVLDHKFVVLGHNLIRGAAGAALLNAELLVARQLFAPEQGLP
jgi:aspartate-semialdehyde dehydrogenase